MTAGLEESRTHSYKTRATPNQRALLRRIHAAGRVFRNDHRSYVREPGAWGGEKLRSISNGGVARLLVNGWLTRVETERFQRVYLLSAGGLRVLELYGDVPRVKLEAAPTLGVL